MVMWWVQALSLDAILLLMFSWARRRQIIYGGGVLVFLLIIFGVPFIVKKISGPSCSDGKKNGIEEEIDCGGACPRLCRDESWALSIVWQRVFREGGGVASALLYGENFYKTGGVFDAQYYVKVYDTAGVLIAEKETIGSILPGSSFAIFAPNFYVGERVPVRAIFEQRAPFEWRQDVPKASTIRTESIQLSTTPQTRVEAVLFNSGEKTLKARAAAILYNANGNAIGASETTASLRGGARVPISFFWRAPFSETPVRAEIISSVSAMEAQ